MTDLHLNASEAATRLGISAKALRLYEQRGLMAPARNAAGWRLYGPPQLARAAEIIALRALGFSLAQVAGVLRGEPEGLEPTLAGHQAVLEDQIRRLGATVGKVRQLRSEVLQGRAPAISELAGLQAPVADVIVAFDLPWPWGGERFELREIRALTYLIGPLGSGKTRLAMCLADELPDAIFLGLDRLETRADAGCQDEVEAEDVQTGDPGRRFRIDQALAWLAEAGATPCAALEALVAGLEPRRPGSPTAVVVDMIEEGLDQPTQEAVIAWLRRRGPGACAVFMLTRSSTILDLRAVGPDEAIILCPANHSPPVPVASQPGAPGYEAVATCLASPAVRARTAGLVAMRQSAGVAETG
ncbi:MAG: MerR family transcriptional regulator [Comamonadaceae bacterium]|nr:MAG: MerR family transcriptional regulator [Comamonadaceae bacterium]